MKSHASINRIYRLIWSQVLNCWVAVAETSRGHGKGSNRKSSKHLCPALIAGAFVMSTAAYAGALPTGGTVVGGSATISESGGNMTINQTTARMAANWESFSIGAGNTVTFNQPSASSVALNRVVGADVSVIQGALRANGQVFLLNPNGVLFTPTAQVDVGGIVASTLSLSTANFMAGNHQFAGSSSNAIVNQGNITTVNGGTIALIAAKITNTGTLTANAGNVLLGAGSMVTLDLGGPVKLEVTQGALETLIANGGAIRADGGHILLTSKAAGDLAASVINNTGLIEAQTLVTGEKGEIILFARGGQINVGGTIKAEGGFVETSGKNFFIAEGTVIKAGQWLIDPVNVTVDSTLASAIQAVLSADGDVMITTDGANIPSTTAGESGSAGNIYVNAPIIWSTARTLTLSAYNDINIDANITASDSGGGMIFLYGQGTANGGSSAYNKSSSVAVTSNSLQWRKGSGPASTRYAIVNGDVFLGGKFIELGINAEEGGKFGTTSKPSLFFGRPNGQVGVGMTADADGFGVGVDLRIDYFLPGSPYEAFAAGYKIAGTETTGQNFASILDGDTIELLPLGAGNTLTAKVTTTLAGNLRVEQLVTLGTTDMYFKNQVTLSNVGVAALDNVSFARDFDPDNTKDVGGGYTTIQLVDKTLAAGDLATVVSATSLTEGFYTYPYTDLEPDPYFVLSGGKQAKILYYTTDSRAAVAVSSGWGGNVYEIAALASVKGATVTDDETMGMVFDVGTLTPGATTSFNYLTSLDNRDTNTILSELDVVSGVGAAPAQLAAIQSAQSLAVSPALIAQQSIGGAPAAFVPAPSSGGGDSTRAFISGGLEYVFVPAPQAGNTPSSASAQEGAPSDSRRPDGAIFSQAGLDPNGFMRVFVVDGGVRLPEELR